jgi:hypothetical protein
MTRHRRKPSRAKPLRSLFLWHRYIGLTSALFVILLTTTGLLLNLTDELSLDSRYVQSGLLLDWYGIKPPRDMITYMAGSTAVTEVGRRVYRNTTLIPRVQAPLLGAVEAHGLVIIGIKDQLLLFTTEGQLVERLDNGAGIPEGIRALGLDAAGNLVVKATHGLYRTDSNILKWQKESDDPIHWAVAAQPPAALRSALQQAYRGRGLTLERLLLDIHSGRIFGSRGGYFVDTAALLFLVLASSGIWLWGRHHANTRQHRRSRQQQTGS